MDQNSKTVRRWIARNFEELKTYHEGKDPRRWILSAMCVRQAISSMMNNNTLPPDIKVYLIEARTALYQLQSGMMLFYKQQFSEAEFRFMATFPNAWMLESFTGVSTYPLHAIFHQRNHMRIENVDPDSGIESGEDEENDSDATDEPGEADAAS
ncbi:unnamed protein product [Orchesella dallaii]|uniref:Uncharacterized protein n=1 Tax=Orchesella dallaii TaxID=48710 RepID=A0ABP1QBB5_9HEXA